MSRSTCLATAAAAVVTVAGSSSANFTFSFGAPNNSLILGRTVIQLYALNNGNTAGNDTGTLLKAFEPIFTMNGSGYRFFVNIDNGGTPDDVSDDTVDFPNAAGPSSTLSSPGNGFSYVRVGSASQTFQVSAAPDELARYARGVSSFRVTEASMSNVNASSTVNGGRGFRVATLVYASSSAVFSSPLPSPPYVPISVTGLIGGDRGVAQPFLVTYESNSSGPFPSDVLDLGSTYAFVNPGGPSGGAFAPIDLSHYGPASLAIGTISAQIADNLTVRGTGDFRTIVGSGFTAADRGTYAVTFTAGDATATFQLIIFPEPAIALGAILGVATFATRQGRPSRLLNGRIAQS